MKYNTFFNLLPKMTEIQMYYNILDTNTNNDVFIQEFTKSRIAHSSYNKKI